ncbi:hypothetical protein CkaCkLH20_12278 [Colletotrichum karsti]|uniref:Uncharacterized protein n=1 Tax=Colletotrichum karsti TaxID=1095194 RepID=A0A9P6HST9_9PEZI|nr:uncharacterized protein CkaCkLH20_12278 [Colletotrichum karsti]KAF9870192.1 hypothetical protein CkaCkLH20_12278 [Colletotrichum karsti]
MALTPRLDPYVRLVYRFYEALILLSILLPVSGHHVVSSINNLSLQDARRRFLKNLCFICDYDKGGDSTTAIAVEERDDACIFWVSSNEGVRNNVTEFLRNILDELGNAIDQQNDQNVDRETFRVLTTEFASPRIRKEARILRNAAMRCIEHLNDMNAQAENLIVWLQHLDFTGLQSLDVCQRAYQVRHDEEMSLVQFYAQDDDHDTHPGPIAQSFRTVRHFVGRLAAHIRAVDQLLDDANRLQTIWQNRYEVERVQRPPSATVPEADAHMTLRGVLRRLLPANDRRYEPYLGFLSHMDASVHIQNKLDHRFQPGGLRLCVHAEIQMLHHFYDQGRKFIAKDQHIACSKFACICCELYFKYHPAGFHLLGTHKRAFPNWGLIGLSEGAKSPRWLEQQSMMSSVIKDLKDLVLRQISELQASSMNHPDSLTQITASLADVGDMTDGEWDEGFEEKEPEVEESKETDEAVGQNEEAEDGVVVFDDTNDGDAAAQFEEVFLQDDDGDDEDEDELDQGAKL